MQEIVHFFRIAGKYYDQTVTVILHFLKQSTDTFLAVLVITALFPGRRDQVSFIYKEDTSICFLTVGTGYA